jgi:putative ATPase
MENTFNIFMQKTKPAYIPLAERCRPKNIEQIVGHEKYLNHNSPLRRQIKEGNLSSMIFWGPPGVGKTTIARVIANETDLPFSILSAVVSGKKELKDIIDKARYNISLGKNNHLLFIDEIHRYNKAQQDGLLHAVEDGTIILIGATTENPSFEIIPPLLSRCQIIKLDTLSVNDLKKIVLSAIREDNILNHMEIKLPGIESLLRYGGGDARKTLNLLEACLHLIPAETKKLEITNELVIQAAQYDSLLYDKKGDYHYDTISAFIKSIRGSDPDAALYYLARMLDAGEDPNFISRRLIILASEDIGNAEPYALSLATAGLQAVHAIGMPEARIVLAQLTTYFASCPKSNASYMALEQALKDVREHPTLQIPLHLRNAPAKMMKELNYGKNYKYPHNYPDHFIAATYLPEEIKNRIYYQPSEQGREKILKDRLATLWSKKRTKNKNKQT